MNINTAPQEIQKSHNWFQAMDQGEPVKTRDHSGWRRGKMAKKKPSRFRKKYVKMAPSIPLVWDWCLLIGGLLVDLAGKNWAYKGSADSPGWQVDWKRDIKGNPRF